MGVNFLTVKAVADSLGITVRTVRERIRDKKIKAYKWGGHWYVFIDDLEKSIKNEGDNNK